MPSAAVTAGAVNGQMQARVFLVGCPRSGTTLLQTLLSAHSDVHSLPETHFFQHLFHVEESRRAAQRPPYHRKRLVRALQNGRRRATVSLGWVSGRRSGKAWAAVPELTESDPCGALRGIAGYRLKAHVERFRALLDHRCLETGKHIWLEKTPDHLYYIAHIQRYFPEARFIHVLRDGEEVVASLYHAALRHEQWQPFLDIDRCIDRWNRALAESLFWCSHPQHLLVRYEALIEKPQPTLARVLHFLGCADEAEVWARYTQAADRLVRADEPWKQANFDTLGDRRKFRCVFDRKQQIRIETALQKPDWAGLARLALVIG